MTRPTADFPPDAIPAELAQAIWGRTRGQPYLTQLYGQLIVERLNREKRRQATAADCAKVKDDLLDQARAYFSDLVRRAPEPAQDALKSLARGERLALATLDPASRRYLLRRSLIDESGDLGIPVLGDYLRREQAEAGVTQEPQR